jgi:hypothetical protein
MRGVIVLGKECLLPAVTALRHVVRDSRNHNSRQSCHVASLSARTLSVKQSPEIAMRHAFRNDKVSYRAFGNSRRIRMG